MVQTVHQHTIAAYAQRFTAEPAAVKYASRFDHGPRRRIHEREVAAVREVLGSVPAHDTVLDMPCGAGRFFPVLSEQFTSIIAADISPVLLGLAGEKAVELGMNVALACADAKATRFQDESVDCVFCNRLLHHLLTSDERLCVLREIHRISRRFAVVSFFDYRRFLHCRVLIKRLQGRRRNYDQHPGFEEFGREIGDAGFILRQTVQVRPFWTAQKLLLLEKTRR